MRKSQLRSCLVMKGWKREQSSVNVCDLFFVRFGGTEAGTFCALSTLAEQVQHDNSVDVYMVSKLYHLKRPGIFSSQVRTLDKNKVQPRLLNAFFRLFNCKKYGIINRLRGYEHN